MRFPGFRRPVDLHTALADTFETYLAQEAKPVPLGAPGISVCRASLLDCAHEVVRQRLIRVISARAAFDWPLPMEAR
jgi:hypothetical protein